MFVRSKQKLFVQGEGKREYFENRTTIYQNSIFGSVVEE